MKKTIEEAAKEYANNYFVMQDNHYSGLMQGFKAGAKYQSEQMYSEEEVNEYAEFCIRCHFECLPPLSVFSWYTQFKKK